MIVGSIVIRCPTSTMAPNAFSEFSLAIALFEKGVHQSDRARSCLVSLESSNRFYTMYSTIHSLSWKGWWTKRRKSFRKPNNRHQPPIVSIMLLILPTSWKCLRVTLKSSSANFFPHTRYHERHLNSQHFYLRRQQLQRVFFLSCFRGQHNRQNGLLSHPTSILALQI